MFVRRPLVQSHTGPEKPASLGWSGGRMRRREFITLVGGGVALPLVARAQQSALPTVGILWPGAEPPAPPRMESFRQVLRQLGCIGGKHGAVELRCSPNT